PLPVRASPRGAEDVGDRGKERARPEAEPLAAVDLEASPLDRALGLARRMAAAGDARPERAAVGQLEQQAERLAAREDVLVEAKLAARPQHAPDLGQRASLVGDRAEDE